MPDITDATFVLAVTDLDAARAFYCDKLGFTEELRVPGWAFVRRGACRLRLGDCPDAQPMARTPDHSWFAYLHVRDIARLHDDVRRNGVQIWHELATKPWGVREFGIVTPDGHRIVFGEAVA